MSKSIDKEMSFLDHLEVFRWHLIRSATAILFFAIISFIFKNIIFDKILLAPREPSFILMRFYVFYLIFLVLMMHFVCLNHHFH